MRDEVLVPSASFLGVIMVYDLLIVGSGAAGLSAGIYAGRYLISTAIVRGKEFGGETAVAALIENYPGYIEIDGFELMMKMKEQVQKVGVVMKDGYVTSIRKEGDLFISTIDGPEVALQSKTVVLATGSRRRRLGVENEEQLTGKGVSYCTTCDSPIYKGKIVAIIGGGDSSVKGANLASQYAERIYLIVRAGALNAEPVNYQRLMQKKNVEVFYNTEVKAIIGNDRLEKIVVSNPINGSTELRLGGLFVEIGAIPNNELAKELGLALDASGYVEVDPMMQTGVAGVFAAGDITNETGGFKQDIVAASQGSIAATSAYKYLEKLKASASSS